MPTRDDHTAEPAATDDERGDVTSAAAEDAAVVEPEQPRRVEAKVMRQARMGRFLGLGAVVGLVLALVLSVFWPSDPNYVPENPLAQFSDLQVFAFLAVYIVPICIGIAGLVGYLLGRAAEKRTATDVVLERGDAREG